MGFALIVGRVGELPGRAGDVRDCVLDTLSWGRLRAPGEGGSPQLEGDRPLRGQRRYSGAGEGRGQVGWGPGQLRLRTRSLGPEQLPAKQMCTQGTPSPPLGVEAALGVHRVLGGLRDPRQQHSWPCEVARRAAVRTSDCGHRAWGQLSGHLLLGASREGQVGCLHPSSPGSGLC